MSALEPIALDGPELRIEPAHEAHAAAMLQAAGSPDTFALFTRQPTPWTEAGCREFLRFLIAHPTTAPLSVFDARTGELVAGTSYCDIRAEHRGLEIGWTWITPRLRGTSVNPRMKRMLLAHVFETDLFPAGPAIRVMLKTHHLNLRSQAAIRKLGAKHEGTLRNHVIMPDGSVRHTVVYSITSDEWPDVKRRLDTRLAGS